ncbi:MAG: DUF1236 domain-containing protein [Rhizobiales bacterium]|nr:DUF1236 domain-containing protein [Hyphomicrobiales bacterium]
MKPGTTGAAPSKEAPSVKGGATIEPKAMPKGQSTQGPSQSPKATEVPSKPRETTGQAPSKEQQPKANQAPAKQQGTTGQAPSAQPKAGQAPAKQQSTTGQGPAGSSGASLTTEQRTKITTIIKQKRVKPVTNVTFAISVGAVVPAAVHFYPLPIEVVEVYPEWRGYLFVLVGDEILVIHPRTHIIVAVLAA